MNFFFIKIKIYNKCFYKILYITLFLHTRNSFFLLSFFPFSPIYNFKSLPEVSSSQSFCRPWGLKKGFQPSQKSIQHLLNRVVAVFPLSVTEKALTHLISTKNTAYPLQPLAAGLNNTQPLKRMMAKPSLQGRLKRFKT